jgi:hypothetical protein
MLANGYHMSDPSALILKLASMGWLSHRPVETATHRRSYNVPETGHLH